MLRLLQPERVEVRDQVAAHAVHVDELLHRDDLVAAPRPSPRAGGGRATSARARTGTPKLAKMLVVEVVAAEQQIVHRGEELAALGALDDAVVVRARERDDLADADLGERLRVGAFVLGRVGDRADADDDALARA